jgi:metallo-beta-lactamase family protein
MHKLSLNRDIPNLPIYVDSPLATRVTEIFRLHPEIYDSEIRGFITAENRSDPFGFDAMRYTQTVQESKDLNFLKEPAVIISASGMMEGGRILHHLRNRITDPRNTVLITGWQAPNTLGRMIVDGQKTIKIFGEEYEVHAAVEVMTGFSGHADREELLAWAGAMKNKPAHTFVVHGEEAVSFSFAENLRRQLNFPNVEVPAPRQSYEL